MNDPLITVLFLIGFLFLNVKIIMQLKKISLYHQISTGYILVHPVIISVFSIMAVYLAETFLDYTVFFSAAVALILSIYNKGFTDKGIFPMVIGGTLRNMIGHEF